MQKRVIDHIEYSNAQYFLTLAEETYPELKGANQLEWLERLEAEHDNMRVALSWASERKEVEVALRMGGALWLFWSMRGYYSEGERWLEEEAWEEAWRKGRVMALDEAISYALQEEEAGA